MKWALRPAASFPDCRNVWDELNLQRGNHPLLDSGFVAPLVKYFASHRTRLAMAADSGTSGAVLLEASRAAMWQTFQPSQAPLGLILLGEIGDGIDRAREILASLPGYALTLSILQQDPDFSAVKRVDGLTVESLDYIQTARLTPTGGFEDYWKSRSKNLVHNLSRQRRRLAEKRVSLEVVADRDPGRVADGVRQYGELESRSWKAGEGTAVAPDNDQGLFYREVLEHFCARGEGVIYRLLLDGRVVAVDLCLERNGMLAILKTTYDESVEGVSLGVLLHQEIFRSAFDEHRVKTIEFYGRVREWHTKWTNDIRTMYHVTLYRHGWSRWIQGQIRKLRRGDA